MEVYVLDSSFKKIKYLHPFDFQWERRLKKSGQFSCVILANDYSSDMKYLCYSEDTEFGIIEQPKYSKKINGEFIELSGKFATSAMNDCVLYPTVYYTSKNVNEMAQSVAETALASSSMLRINPSSITNYAGTMKLDSWQQTGGYAADAMYKLLDLDEASFAIRRSHSTGVITLDIYKGTDRTKGSGNNYVTFATSLGDMSNPEITVDDSAMKNYAIVAGSGEGASRIYITVDLADYDAKVGRRTLWVDAKDENYDSTKQTLAQYKSSLYSRGLEKLNDNTIIVNCNFDVNNKGYSYRTDYDLGDLVDVVLDEVGLSYKRRITEITERWQSNRLTIKLTMGNSIPTIYERVRTR